MNFVSLVSNPGNLILSIVLFFVALGVLVTLHELGHFIAAKSFNVYCSDFSIGFGPKILKLKRKKGETTFSIGILPLGGYVSMFGEGSEDELPEGVKVPESRSLTGIARYKRIIIMSAGIVMNFILAYVIFLISASCFPQVTILGYYKVSDTALTNSISYPEGETEKNFSTNDTFKTTTLIYKDGKFIKDDGSDKKATNQSINLLSSNYFYVFNKDGKQVDDTKYVAVLSSSFSLVSGINDTDISKNIYIYKASDETVDGLYVPYTNNNSLVPYSYVEGQYFNIPISYFNADTDQEFSSIDDFKNIKFDEDSSSTETNKVYKTYNLNLKLESASDKFNEIGISFYKFDVWLGAKSFAKAGESWVQSTSLISQAIGGLFIGQGWSEVGGPLAIFSQTTSILENNPFYFYLQTWGTISVNLALFNLLPFPGLDGWQILVELIEGSVNEVKKISFKAKHKKLNKDGTLAIEGEESKENSTPIDINESKEVTATKESNLTIGEKKIDDSNIYKEWKIPAKVKTIMSYVGLGLLFAFMLIVFIKDIFQVF